MAGHPNYSVYLCDALGERLADASEFISLRYVFSINTVSALVLVLPGTFDRSKIIIPDGRVQVWRHVAGGREYLEGVWLIKVLGLKTSADGVTTMVIGADSALCLLSEPGRFVNYYAGSAQTDKSGAADDVIKAVARENIGSSAGAGRDLSSYISIEPDHGLGATVSKAFAWRDCLKVMQELAADSTQAGVFVAFDVVSTTGADLVFRTYTGQRGADHRWPNSPAPVLLGPAYGNLGETEFEINYRDETTYAKAAGQEQGAARITREAQDDGRIGLSPFGLREAFVQANTADPDALTSEARARVREGRPRLVLGGRVLDVPDTRYGEHWGFGDYVTIDVYGYQRDSRIGSVSVSVEDNTEKIDAYVRVEE